MATELINNNLSYPVLIMQNLNHFLKIMYLKNLKERILSLYDICNKDNQVNSYDIYDIIQFMVCK